MSRDSNGTYTLPPTYNPVVVGTPITTDWGNVTLGDVASALSDSLSRSGQGGMSAPLKHTDGAEATPSLTFTNETLTGFYRPSTADVRLSLGGLYAVGWAAGVMTLRAPTTLPYNFLAAGIDSDIDITITPKGAGVTKALGTGAFKVPNGTTAQRPSVAYAGYLRYNDTLTVLEMFAAGSWMPAASTAAAQTYTLPQRGAQTTDNDLSFDLNVTNNFSCTPSAGGALTFTNIATTQGQSGLILLINTGGHAISAAATTKMSVAALAAINVTGTYLLTYYCNGTNVYVVASGAMV